MKSIIVREYLSSLGEDDELDYLFPILLEVMGFKIISTPKITKGLPQYGKDVIAIGIDPTDNKKKRFYFEIKGGEDKNITTNNFNKRDGILESIREAKFRSYKDNSNPEFNSLPVKIALVHNGQIRANVKETFDGFIDLEFPRVFNSDTSSPNFEFERWDIFTLTDYFSKYLFNEYLLVDDESVLKFKKVLVLNNTPRNDYNDFQGLIDSIFLKAGDYHNLSKRKRLLLFETINLVGFIIHSYSKDSGNLEPAKKCLSFSTLRLWSWILKNNLEEDEKVKAHFERHLRIFLRMLDDYFEKTLPVALLKDGLYSPNGGRYEQIGYPLRAFDYQSYLLLYFEFKNSFEGSENKESVDKQKGVLATLANNNDGTTRPLLDNHSIPICQLLLFLMRNKKFDEARIYLRNVFQSIQIAYDTHKRLPDGRNHIESVVRLIASKQKSIFYEDKTSHLIGILFEFLAVLNMEEEYTYLREYFKAIPLYCALFVPYDDKKLSDLFPNENKNHELHLFSHELRQEGYQSEIILDESFSIFKEKTLKKTEFSYEYRTSKAGYPFLLTLTHTYFKTPVFPNEWRKFAEIPKQNELKHEEETASKT